MSNELEKAVVAIILLLHFVRVLGSADWIPQACHALILPRVRCGAPRVSMNAKILDPLGSGLQL